MQGKAHMKKTIRELLRKDKQNKEQEAKGGAGEVSRDQMTQNFAGQIKDFCLHLYRERNHEKNL